MIKELTIFWTTLLDYESVLIQELAELHKADARELRTEDLAAEMAPALTQGAVVVIASGDKHASLALSLGADEVIRSGELTGRVLDDAIQRARCRAAARRDRDSQRSFSQANERMAFALLAAAIGYEFTNLAQVSGAGTGSLDCARRVLDVAQQLAARGSSWVPDASVFDAAHRERQPGNANERDTGDRTSSLSRATELVELFERLGCAGAPSEPIGTTEFLRSFVELMSRFVKPWAELHVATEGDGHATVPRVVLTCALAAVLANAIEHIRMSHRSDGFVKFRSCEREDCVLIEVEHNGHLSVSDLRPGVLDACFGNLAGGQPVGSDLAQVREHLRHVGGELLVDSGESKTLVRVFLPTTRVALPLAALKTRSRGKTAARG